MAKNNNNNKNAQNQQGQGEDGVTMLEQDSKTEAQQNPDEIADFRQGTNAADDATS